MKNNDKRTYKRSSQMILESICQEFPEINLEKINILIQIMKFSKKFFTYMEKYFSKYNLSNGRFKTLSFLYFARSRDYIVLSDIAKETNVTKSTVTGLVDGLEASGLVERYTDHSIDRRKVFIRITEYGLETFKLFFPDHIKDVSELLADLTPEEMTIFTTLFGKIDSKLDAISRDRNDLKGEKNEN